MRRPWRLACWKKGETLPDFVGPLGRAGELKGLKKVAVVGGGLGCAIAYPQAKKLYETGCEVDLITGFRSKEIITLEDEMHEASTRLHLVTDDGSNGRKALVTQYSRWCGRSAGELIACLLPDFFQYTPNAVCRSCSFVPLSARENGAAHRRQKIIPSRHTAAADFFVFREAHTQNFSMMPIRRQSRRRPPAKDLREPQALPDERVGVGQIRA